MNTIERSSFAKLVRGREEQFPTLARAAANTVEAFNPKVEWLVGEGDHLATVFNYCQLFRFPFGVVARDQGNPHAFLKVRGDARDELLRAVEASLLWGHRDITTTNRRYCGGVLELLGRDLRDDDILTLRPLAGREPYIRTVEWDRENVPLDNPYWEWIAETSLQVLAAEQIPAPVPA